MYPIIAERKAPHVDSPWIPSGRSTNIPPMSAILAELKVLEAEVARRSGPARLRASIPEKFRPLMAPRRTKGAKGGRGSAKSQTAGRLLLIKALDHFAATGEGLRWVCVREIQLSLDDSVKRLLKDLIDEFGLEAHGFEVEAARIVTPGGGVIKFQGMQNHTAMSVKSLEGFHGAWVEEANTLSDTSLGLLTPTIREDGSELWFTWNPEKPTDPVDKMFADAIAMGDPDTILVEANYLDNPHFPEVLKKERAKAYATDPELAAHVWGGQYKRRSKATVFKNVRVMDFETPRNAQFLLGGDWGFATDPTAGVRMFILPERPLTLWVDREVGGVGIEIEDTPALFDTLFDWDPVTRAHSPARDWELVADSARPETISYMKRHGYPRIVPAAKGANSVEEGVQFLKGYEIIVHATRCPKTAEELVDYSYKVHRLTGEVLPELVEIKNHYIDAMRYALEKVRKPRKGVSL